MRSGPGEPADRPTAEPPDDAAELTRRAETAVAAALVGVRRLGVAFSGGVDSSVLLALAARVLRPDRVVAIIGVSPSLPEAERVAAHRVAAGVGVAVTEIATHEGDRAEYVANGPDRCYHCKDELFSRISDELVAAQRLDAVAYGQNVDDVDRPDRPGAKAADRHRVLSPLVSAGLGKPDIRRIARALGLPCADKPAAPCLASRIPHHHPVTPEKLRQIEQVEAGLHELGFAESRVRHHDDIARIELPADDLARAVTEPARGAIRDAVRRAGFRYATIDLGGVQSGAFTLPLVQVGRG